VGGAGLVILDELTMDPHCLQPCFMISFKEIATGIPENFRFYNDQSFNICSGNLHLDVQGLKGTERSRATLYKYIP
jgi:hypothetical protein